MVTEPMAQMYRIVPIEFDGDTLTVAMCDPQKLRVQDELRTFLGFDIRVVVATEPAMNAALERYYGDSTESVESIVADMEDDAELAAAAAGISADGPIDLDDVEALADSAPVRKLLNMVLLMAIRSTPATCTSSRSKTNSASASRPTACCTKWCRRRATWRSPSRPASRSWRISTSPSAACRRTAASS